MTTYLLLVLMLGISVMMFVILRRQDREGVIVAFPKNITRDHSPLMFRITMGMGLLGFVASIVLSMALLIDVLLGK